MLTGKPTYFAFFFLKLLFILANITWVIFPLFIFKGISFKLSVLKKFYSLTFEQSVPYRSVQRDLFFFSWYGISQCGILILFQKYLNHVVFLVLCNFGSTYSGPLVFRALMVYYTTLWEFKFSGASKTQPTRCVGMCYANGKCYPGHPFSMYWYIIKADDELMGR